MGGLCHQAGAAKPGQDWADYVSERGGHSCRTLAGHLAVSLRYVIAGGRPGLRLVVLLMLVGGCVSTPSKGTMPPQADRQQNAVAMPDFIAVGGRNGEIVGYVSKDYFLQERAGPGRGAADPWPVYGDDLRTIVGYLVSGKGFVPRAAVYVRVWCLGSGVDCERVE